MSYTIGKLARALNVNIETIRYYQRVGLLDKPTKPVVGYRQYSCQYITRIRFIKRAQQLGFTLNEIAELLSLGDNHCNDIRAIAEQKHDRICTQIEDLKQMRDILEKLIECCLNNKSTAPCSIIDALSDKSKLPP